MKTHLNIPEADSFYAALIDVHRGLESSESAKLNARLLFLLANQVGDHDVLLACLRAARTPLSQH
ncbi:Protein of unknown function [Burkholderia sp. GAS332]|jgi:hypothetical protein|uniref:DUF2783 domain-containing protein n=1 Tax=Paraburkholderia TaxID=1822464 RepID=UPI00092829C0|nr:Protein of unknown function [Burkholderia sp. GAS332]